MSGHRPDEPSADDTELDALAAEYGIEAEFVDARGATRRASSATKRALLAAMGVRAGNAAEVRTAREARLAALWGRVLPPVIVAESSAVAVPIVLPRSTHRLHWRVALETGGERTGDAVFGALPSAQERECGGRRLERRLLTLDAGIPCGYHRFSLDSARAETRLIVTPGTCWLPPAVRAGKRLGGIALQLYLLRSRRNWGIGDFTDLRRFVEFCAQAGADMVGLNPLHAMFFDEPQAASPYSPASRLALNALYIDVAAIPEFAAAEEAVARTHQRDFQAALEASRAADLVDYATVAALKLDVLRLLFAAFSDTASPERKRAFAAFRAAGSARLERTYLFIALREHFASLDEQRAAWRDWPAEYRDPASADVAHFAAQNAAEIAFVAWLDWIADTQLEAAARAAAPMRVGLYRDLAVGAAPGGAETWCDQRAVLAGVRIGAPPDIDNPAGQNWNLPPFDPYALREDGYAAFIDLLRANMRYAGGLRIDHVMALQRLYWIPEGAAPSEGAYVRYPLDDLVGIVALESRRARCLVVGEDLGTVPAGFRDRMAVANILSYRVLFFERAESGPFKPPADYPREALAVLGSHDLPTLRAWWSGADIALRARLGLLPDPAAAADARRADRGALVAALLEAGVLNAVEQLDDDALFAAAHAFLASTPAALAIAQIDDISAETDPVNVPTTSNEHPNWRRRLGLTLEELPAAPRWRALFDILRGAGRLRDA